jgi:hypothetical protein
MSFEPGCGGARLARSIETPAGPRWIDGEEVEAELGEVGELLDGRGVGDEVGEDQADAAEAAALAAHAGELGEGEGVGVAEDDALDAAAAVDEEAELASELRARGRAGRGRGPPR